MMGASGPWEPDMSATAPTPQAFVVPSEPIWRLSVAQYRQMVDVGILTNTDRVELLDGLLDCQPARSRPSLLFPTGDDGGGCRLRNLRNDREGRTHYSRDRGAAVGRDRAIGNFANERSLVGCVREFDTNRPGFIVCERTAIGCSGAFGKGMGWLRFYRTERTLPGRCFSGAGYQVCETVAEGERAIVAIAGQRWGAIELLEILP